MAVEVKLAYGLDTYPLSTPKPIFRRRKAAHDDISRSRSMKSWHSDVLHAFLEHELYPQSFSDFLGSVRLKTRPYDEAAVYLEWKMRCEVWGALPDLDPRLALSQA